MYVVLGIGLRWLLQFSWSSWLCIGFSVYQSDLEVGVAAGPVLGRAHAAARGLLRYVEEEEGMAERQIEVRRRIS